LEVYRRYKEEYGVEFTKQEQKTLLRDFSTVGVEVVVGKKMFR
jgi:hypothetical protein